MGLVTGVLLVMSLRVLEMFKSPSACLLLVLMLYPSPRYRSTEYLFWSAWKSVGGPCSLTESSCSWYAFCA